MTLHYYHPSPLLFDFGPLSLHWYGLLISLSVIICFYLGQKLARQYRLPDHLFFDLVFYLLIFGLLGARLWHVFSEWSYYLHAPLDILQIWQGGLAIHGAIFAGIIFVYYYYRKRRDHLKELNFLLLLDIFAPLIALGQAIGRWGNYFNQELYGRPINLPWAIPIDPINRLPGWENFQYFHPIFLYESLWCLLIFAFLIYLHQLRLKKPEPKQGIVPLFHCSIVKKNGTIFFLYLIFYSLGRFLIGFLRIDPQFNFWGLRLDQWVSMVLFSIGAIYLVHNSYRRQKESRNSISKS